jgi:uncharacterized protein YraI
LRNKEKKMGHHNSQGDPAQLSNQTRLHLVVHAGPFAGKGFSLTNQSLTIGRASNNDVVLDDKSVSLYHARLFQQEGQVILEDLGSANTTTQVNGAPIVGQHVLQRADTICIGTSVFGVTGFPAMPTILMSPSSDKTSFSTFSPAGASPPPPSPPVRPATPSRFGPPAWGWISKWQWGIAGVVVALLFFLFMGGAGIIAIFLAYSDVTEVTNLPEVVVDSPANGSQIQLHKPVTVKTIVTNVAEVERLEFWVDGPHGSQIQETKRVNSQSLTSWATLFRWNPDRPGSYTLEIKAYDATDQVSASAVAMVNVADERPVPAPPGLPGTTAYDRMSLVAKTNLTVRAGPGEAYEVLAVLPPGTRIIERGRSEDQQWWQIMLDEPNRGVGWIPADSNLVTTADSAPLAIQASSLLPTSTITPTNTPAPTSTPAPTDTPTPAPTDTPLPTAPPAPTQAPVPAFNQSPGNGPPGQGGQGGQGGSPDFASAAEQLGVTEEALLDALGDPPPDFEAAAATLGVSVEALQSAFPSPGANR